MARIREEDFGYPSGDGLFEIRGNGARRIRFYLGDDPVTGKKVYSRSITVKGSMSKAKAAANRLRNELIDEYEAKRVAIASKRKQEIAVAEYAQVWLNRREASEEIKQSTLDRYKPPLKRVIHYFGRMNLSELDVPKIKDAYAIAAKRDDLTQNQLHMMHRVLRQMLDDAEADGLIESNPAANRRVRAPKPASAERKALSQEEAVRLKFADCSYEEQSRFIGIQIGLATGLRRGEVLGLQWKHVSLGDKPCIAVRQQLVKKHRGYEPPKADSYRTMSIDEDTAACLRKWKEIQQRMMASTADERARLKAKRDRKRTVHPSGKNTRSSMPCYSLFQTEETAVVTDSYGEPFNPDNYGRWFRRFCCQHGFGRMVDDEGHTINQRRNAKGHPLDRDGKPYSRSNPKPVAHPHYEGLKFHELRHTNITLQIGNGMDIKTVQQRAGHKRASTTTDIYSHAIPANDEKAAEVIGSLLQRCDS